MKTIFKSLLVSLFLSVILAGSAAAQEKPAYVTFTKRHWNMDYKDFNMDTWKAGEKEYLDKVTSKNPYILFQDILMHYFTADNSEIVWVLGYRSWDDIQKAQAAEDSLVKLAWPDEAKRKEFMNKLDAYYTKKHSDEIYTALDGAKLPAEHSDKPEVIWIQKKHLAYPEDGTTEEIAALQKEFRENVIDKNDYIRGYYPQRHAWGSNGQDFIEAYEVSSLGDLQKALDEDTKLIEAHWPDEAKRKAFFEKRNKYFTGWHGDYIYRTVPELSE